MANKRTSSTLTANNRKYGSSAAPIPDLGAQQQREPDRGRSPPMPQDPQKQIRPVEQDEQVFLLTGVAAPIHREVRGEPRQQHQPAASRRKTQPPLPQQEVDLQSRNQQQERRIRPAAIGEMPTVRASTTGNTFRYAISGRLGATKSQVGHCPVQEQLGFLQVEGAVRTGASRRLPHSHHRQPHQ